jgi:hypothetical protein
VGATGPLSTIGLWCGVRRRAEGRVAAAAERRHQRKEEKELLDELLPRATGGTREARVSSTTPPMLCALQSLWCLLCTDGPCSVPGSWSHLKQPRFAVVLFP